MFAVDQTPKTAEILCVGTELLMGNTVNTNAAFLARGLAEAGLKIGRASCRERV